MRSGLQGVGKVEMVPQTQEEHEQRPRGHADGCLCSSVGCEGVSWGMSLEREGGAQGLHVGV